MHTKICTASKQNAFTAAPAVVAISKSPTVGDFDAGTTIILFPTTTTPSHNLNLMEHSAGHGLLPPVALRKVVPKRGAETMAIYGYARASTQDQELGLQVSALREAGVAGMADAKQRGVHTGRKHTLTPHQRAEAARMHADGKSLGQIAMTFGCSRSVAHRAVQAAA